MQQKLAVTAVKGWLSELLGMQQVLVLNDPVVLEG